MFLYWPNSDRPVICFGLLRHMAEYRFPLKSQLAVTVSVSHLLRDMGSFCFVCPSTGIKSAASLMFCYESKTLENQTTEKDDE